MKWHRQVFTPQNNAIIYRILTFSVVLNQDPPHAARRRSLVAIQLTKTISRRSGMHIGYATGFQHQSGPGLNDTTLIKDDLNMALLAESLGFESIWVTEHHFSDYSISPAPFQRLHTSRRK
jgi:hypothetical protein